MTELEKSLQDVIDAKTALSGPLRLEVNEVDYWYHVGTLRGLAIAMELIQGISGDCEDGQ